jgi:hypothetical protein
MRIRGGSLSFMPIPEGALISANKAFASLIDLPLSDMWRYLGFQKFEFGEQKPHLNRKGEETTWADWSLVVNCAWRIEGPEGFVLSSGHFTPERRDTHAHKFYESLAELPPIVEEVQVLDNGALRIKMSGGYLLAVDPNGLDEDTLEDWRLRPPEYDQQGHLVLEGNRLEWSKDT